MTTHKDQVIEETIAQQAIEWFVAHREGGLLPRQHIEYLNWLKASPRHIEAYLRLVGMAGKIPEALQGLGLDLEERLREAARERSATVSSPFPEVRTGRREVAEKNAWRRPLVAAAVTLSVLILVGLVAYWPMGRAAGWMLFVPADQQRVVTLEDGSVARLDSNTRVHIVYSPTRRLIELSEGQALFTVTHDGRRPFIVRAAGHDIVALGTQFDVTHRDRGLEVTVVEGRVEIVGTRAEQGTAIPSLPRLPPVQLIAGQQIQVSGGGKLSAPRFVDAAATTAWTQKAVSFTGSSLEAVAEEFNRHTGASISIEDADLRAYKVNGVFQAYDLESFLGYLQQLPGIVVVRGPQGEVRVRRR